MMLKKILPKWVNGLLVGSVLILNVIIWGVVVLALGVIKLVLPLAVVSDLLHLAYKGWCSGNCLALWLSNARITTCVRGELNSEGWYLLMSNHISWLDIVVLSGLNVLPAPKFFLKDELKYVPLIGSGAWAMGMPFMKRVSKAQLAKNPKLKGLDVARTKRSCKDFRNHPTTIINFVEGTRFTPEKHQKQQSPFSYLLKPKAGGAAFALEVLGEQFDALLNTTLIYKSAGSHICANLLLGRLESINVSIEVQAITATMIGNYQQNSDFRASFQQYINQTWQHKDNQLVAHFHAQQQGHQIAPEKELEAP